jgi:hypothetical protein
LQQSVGGRHKRILVKGSGPATDRSAAAALPVRFT